MPNAPRRRRLAIRLAVCAVIGALVTVSVAWALAWAHRAGPYQKFESYRASGLRVWRGRDGLGYRGAMWMASDRARSEVVPEWCAGFPARDPTVCCVPFAEAWTPRAHDRDDRLLVEAMGLPLPAVIRVVDSPGGVVDWKLAPSRQFVLIEWQPDAVIWPGFALDTAFYAAIAFALWSAPGAVRRRRRRARGLCPACGYDLEGAPSAGGGVTCPECGG